MKRLASANLPDKITSLADFLYAVLHFDTFVEMQAQHPLSLSRSLDYLFAHPQFRDHVDAARVGGFGASQGLVESATIGEQGYEGLGQSPFGI